MRRFGDCSSPSPRPLTLFQPASKISRSAGVLREREMSPMPPRTIVVLATLDTKGPEADFLRACIAGHGQQALVIDTGVIGSPAATADVSREEVAAAGGRALAELLASPTREAAAPVMAAGATRIVAE